MYKRFLLSAMLFVSLTSGYTQVNFTDKIIPPSPAVASITPFSDPQKISNTGAINTSIPLFSFDPKGMSVPINLNYSTNGIKVDQISSRVGTGWSCNPGGMISRIVYGQRDELSTQILPPNLSVQTPELYNFYDFISMQGLTDAQPDIYSYNFGSYSGKFIMIDGVVTFLTGSNLKIIQYDGGKGFIVWAPDGTQYFFGGDNATEKSRTVSSCANNPEKIPNAWLLTKILTTDNDSTVFRYHTVYVNYVAGSSQTITKKDIGRTITCATTDLCNEPIDQNCITRAYNDGILIDEISSSNYGKIKFSYIDRPDILDDKLIKEIALYSSQDTLNPLKKVVLDYTYSHADEPASIYESLTKRPFLTSVKQYGDNNVLIGVYKFNYDDIDNMAPRGSYSQDWYGFYNGKTNTTLIPNLNYGNPRFPTYLANRSIDWDYAKKGLLTKLVYPTGGYDSILYEPNTINKAVEVQPTTIVNDVSGYGSGYRTAVIYNSVPFIALYTQTQVLSASCSYQGDPADFNSAYHRISLNLIDNTTGLTVYTQNRIDVDIPFSASVNLIQGHSYNLVLTSYGAAVYGYASIPYYTSLPSNININVVEGGSRVAKVFKFDGKQTEVRKYLYGTPISNYTESSGVSYEFQEYKSTYITKDLCPKPPAGNDNPFPVESYMCVFDAITSNSIASVYLSESPVSYSYITECVGDDWEGGAIEHHYYTDGNTPGRVVLGERMLGIPLCNYGLMNGLEAGTRFLKKRGQDVVSIKEVYNHYKEDERGAFERPAYAVRKNYTATLYLNGPQSLDFGRFDVMEYKIIGKWFYIDTTTVVERDDNNNVLVTSTVYRYDNIKHQLPSMVRTIASDGTDKMEMNLYPDDYAVGTSSLDVLKSYHIINPVIEKILFKSGSSGGYITGGQLTGFYDNRPGKIKSISFLEIQKPIATNLYKFSNQNVGVVPGNYAGGNYLPDVNYRERLLYKQYNTAGRLIERQKEKDVNEVFLWGYNNLYPVAQIVGAGSPAVSGIINQSLLDNAQNYSESDVRAELNKLRTIPGALVTTYTYKPLVGMTSATDPSGKTVFYEYDGFQRLKLIRDQEGKIVKQFDYTYQGQ